MSDGKRKMIFSYKNARYGRHTGRKITGGTECYGRHYYFATIRLTSQAEMRITELGLLSTVGASSVAVATKHDPLTSNSPPDLLVEIE